MADGTSTAGAAKEGAVGMLSPRSAAGCAALMLCGMRPVLSALIFSSRVTFSPRVFACKGVNLWCMLAALAAVAAVVAALAVQTRLHRVDRIGKGATACV